jgi:eukaryotic-like serine/threonine-protein kinase
MGVGRLEELQSDDPERVGSYLLLARLGAGGMGQVFLGRSPGGRLVAVKVIRAELASDRGFRARFAREIAAARKVSGLFTAAVVDADPEARQPWLVTGFVNGPSLSQAVTEHGPLPTASVLALAAGLAEGLGAVHAAGTVHRDLKPSNVLLAADGPRLIDFGISQAADLTVLTTTGTVIGSPGFMSPEQAEGNAIGPASDVFSLGAVLVFAATGEGPFGTGTPSAQLYRVVHAEPRLGGLSGEVRPLAERCLAKEPAQRPTAAQFLAELAAAHPSAADLADWLPPSILPETAPLSTPTGHIPERSAPVSAPLREDVPASPAGAAADPDGSVAPAPSRATPSAAAGSGPPAPPSPPARPVPKADMPLTVTAAPLRRPAPPVPAERRSGPGPVPAHPEKVHREPETSRDSAAGRRRWRWAISIAAAVAVVGVVVGVAAAAPWSGPAPVLRPSGLVAGSATASSVAFRWSGPATGPAPTRYQIFQNGQLIGSVPGTTTFYNDARLAPASSYRLQVAASRGGTRSPRSAVLKLTTATPPISAAVLNGPWTANYTVTSVVPTEPVIKVGEKWAGYWSFAPTCAIGPCDVSLSGNFGAGSFTATLTRTGAVYAGTTTMNNFERCLHAGDTRDTLHIRIQVLRAAPQTSVQATGSNVGAESQVWEATSWSGTVVVDKPDVADVGKNCYASTYKTSVTSSSSF